MKYSLKYYMFWYYECSHNEYFSSSFYFSTINVQLKIYFKKELNLHLKYICPTVNFFKYFSPSLESFTYLWYLRKENATDLNDISRTHYRNGALCFPILVTTKQCPSWNFKLNSCLQCIIAASITAIFEVLETIQFLAFLREELCILIGKK